MMIRSGSLREVTVSIETRIISSAAWRVSMTKTRPVFALVASTARSLGGVLLRLLVLRVLWLLRRVLIMVVWLSAPGSLGDTFGCLTAFLRLGMFLQESTHETGCHGLVTMAMMVARRSGDISSTHRMLSRKKGRQYGEGHQKALQISVRWLSLGGVLVDGRERESC